jgi:DNA replication protein DnaC
MKHPEDVDRFEALLRGEGVPGWQLKVAQYETGLPRKFWRVCEAKAVAEEARAVVDAYVRNVKVARRHGYGLALVGPNGSGKTTAAAFVVNAALRRSYRVAYWTVPSLEADFKRGFNDRLFNDAVRIGLFESDFVVLDELAKERRAAGDDWMRTQVEHVLKARYDEGLPTVLISNGDLDTIGAVYGESVGDLLRGRFRSVIFDGDTMRKHDRSEMNTRMGW